MKFGLWSQAAAAAPPAPPTGGAPSPAGAASRRALRGRRRCAASCPGRGGRGGARPTGRGPGRGAGRCCFFLEGGERRREEEIVFFLGFGLDAETRASRASAAATGGRRLGRKQPGANALLRLAAPLGLAHSLDAIHQSCSVVLRGRPSARGAVSRGGITHSDASHRNRISLSLSLDHLLLFLLRPYLEPAKGRNRRGRHARQRPGAARGTGDRGGAAEERRRSHHGSGGGEGMRHSD